MSAPLAGKFQDHYLILGIEPKADSEAIQAAYQKASKKYHKDNPETGDEDKLAMVNLAYEVLCDASLRAEFDKLKGFGQDTGNPQFTGGPFFETLRMQYGLRAALLSVLYDRRHQKPYRPALSMRHLDSLFNVSNDELNFALWYLKQRGLAESDDKSNLQISVAGMDFLEAQQPPPEMVYGFLKPGAVLDQTAPPDAAAEPAKAAPPHKPAPKGIATKAVEERESVSIEQRESVSKVLSRALARR